MMAAIDTFTELDNPFAHDATGDATFAEEFEDSDGIHLHAHFFGVDGHAAFGGKVAQGQDKVELIAMDFLDCDEVICQVQASCLICATSCS
jgi:hypothetical protein